MPSPRKEGSPWNAAVRLTPLSKPPVLSSRTRREQARPVRPNQPATSVREGIKRASSLPALCQRSRLVRGLRPIGRVDSARGSLKGPRDPFEVQFLYPLPNEFKLTAGSALFASHCFARAGIASTPVFRRVLPAYIICGSRFWCAPGARGDRSAQHHIDLSR